MDTNDHKLSKKRKIRAIKRIQKIISKYDFSENSKRITGCSLIQDILSSFPIEASVFQNLKVNQSPLNLFILQIFLDVRRGSDYFTSPECEKITKMFFEHGDRLDRDLFKQEIFKPVINGISSGKRGFARNILVREINFVFDCILFLRKKCLSENEFIGFIRSIPNDMSLSFPVFNFINKRENVFKAIDSSNIKNKGFKKILNFDFTDSNLRLNDYRLILEKLIFFLPNKIDKDDKKIFLFFLNEKLDIKSNDISIREYGHIRVILKYFTNIVKVENITAVEVISGLDEKENSTLIYDKCVNIIKKIDAVIEDDPAREIWEKIKLNVELELLNRQFSSESEFNL